MSITEMTKQTLLQSRKGHLIENHVCGGFVVSYICHGVTVYAKSRFASRDDAAAWIDKHLKFQIQDV